MAENDLSNPIPNSLGDLNRLESLILCDNQLSGSIPESIGNLNSLQYLDLSYNRLSGSIPDSLGENLKKLGLGPAPGIEDLKEPGLGTNQGLDNLNTLPENLSTLQKRYCEENSVRRW